MALETMIYKFLAVLVIAIIIGTAIGGICILCIGKCCQRGQRRRLLELQKASSEMYQFRRSGSDSPNTSRTREGASPNLTGAGFAIKPHLLQTAGTLEDFTPATKPKNVVMDTSADQNEEEQDVVANLQTDQSKEDFGAMLSARGFNEFN